VSRSNIHGADFDEPREFDGFRARRARIGYALGAERLGVSLWELSPGEAAYPYHFHLAEQVDYWDGEEPPQPGEGR
jgi:uncharacterized cupin superfamily protein